jgi:hypothetical protein
MADKKYADPLDVILDRPVAFHRGFKIITNSTVAALFLSQAYYWSNRTSDALGWFYKTQDDWENETGLSRNEQETARKILKRLGILEEKRVGIPAQMYYRVRKDRVAELLDFQSAGFPQSGKSSLQDSSNQECDIPANINRYSENTTETTYGEEPVGADAPARIADFPEDCRAGAALMHDLFKIIPPEKPERDEKGGDFALWIKGLRALIKLAREYNVPLERALRLAHQRWNQAPFTVAHPGALKKIMTSALAQQTQSQRSEESADEFSLAEHLKNFKPRSPEA